MPCNHTRLDVSRIVLGVIRRIHKRPTIVEASIFGFQGINADAQFRTTYFSPIRQGIEAGDCRIRKFSPADCERAESVADIVDAVWNDVKPDVSALAVGAAAIQPMDRRTARARESTKAQKPTKARKSAKARKPAKPRKATKSSKSRESTKSKAKTKKR